MSLINTLDMTPKAKAIEETMDKLGYTKIKQYAL
jgi:hypothetical protein